MLRYLALVNCSINTDAVKHAASTLARLPHLQDLLLVGPGVSVSIAAHLTGLTSLILGNDADTDQMFKVAAQNTGLVQLRFAWSPTLPLFMGSHQRTLLSTCTSLTQLDIAGFHIDGQVLDLLLSHCPSITDLTLGATTLDSSRADRQCSWRKLRLRGPREGSLLQLAYLPLRSVQELVEGCGVLLGSLYLPPPDAVPAAQLPSLLQHAASNLATCPAWIHAAPARLSLRGGGQRLAANQLFQALAPLGAGHVAEMTIELQGHLQLGSAEMRALASSVGGGLQTLRLSNCTLLGAFWRALAHHFTHLSYLDLSSEVRLPDVWEGVTDIAMYLSLRSCSWTQPMLLKISAGVLQLETQLQLEEHVSRWQLPNIALETEYPSDEDEEEEEQALSGDGVEEEAQGAEEEEQEDEEEGEGEEDM
jgi:hypothetical protein